MDSLRPSERRRWVLSGVVLAVVAALTATAVVALRGSESPPMAAAQPLQVGVQAPSLAVEGESVPILVSATGREALALVELWVNGAVVDSVAPAVSSDHLSLTLHWSASGPGVANAHARVVDAAGGVGISNTAFVRVATAPIAVIVDDPEGSTLAEVAAEQGVDPDVVVAINPGADPAERLAPGSVVFLPRLDPRPGPPSSDPGISIDGAVVHLTEPVDGVFLYLTFGGEVYRVPESPADLIPGNGVLFDLAPYLPPLPDGEIAVEVWGRSGGEVALLASLVLPASALLAPATDLVAFWDLAFLAPIPVKSLAATDAESVEFEWSSNLPHSGVRWFLATVKPGAATALTPTGLLQTGLANPEDGLRRFLIDLSVEATPNLAPVPITLLPIAPAPGGVAIDAGVGTRTLPPLGPPGTTWAWVIPVDSEGEPVGPPSEPVRIVVTEAPFDPTIAPPFDVVSIEVVIPPAPNFSLADCVRILAQTPPFPSGVGLGFYLSPDGSVQYKGGGGTKITGTLPYTLDEVGRALYPFTACPGERGNFQWGSVGCGANVLCHVSKGLTDLGAAAEAFGEFLVEIANELSDAYNELKAWAIDQVASAICPDAVAGACKTMINIAVDALLTTVGIPPTMPNFDDLANVAKGELVDLAMDQLGVGSACDALAQAGTGKTCGELATQLENMDACSFAPKGQEDHCRDLVVTAQAVCDLATQAEECELATKNALDLLAEGVEIAVEESIEAIEEQVTKAALGSLGFYPASLWGHYGAGSSEHHCHWGGPNNDQVICPPWSPDDDQSPLPFPVPIPSGGEDQTPPGCHIGSFGQDDGRVVCSFPPGEILAIPEPLGQRQPIEVKVILARNDNLLPEDFACGPISAVATTITPRGAIGQPYLAASTEFPSRSLFFGNLYPATMFLSKPNPHVQIPDDQKPPPPEGLIAEAFAETEDILGFGLASSEWRYLLEAGSFVSIVVYGECIPKTYPDTYLGIAGEIPPPQPRITPGAP